MQQKKPVRENLQFIFTKKINYEITILVIMVMLT